MVPIIQICKMKYLLFLICLFTIYKEAHSNDILTLINLPNSFSISIYANVPNARQMALTPDGILFVGSRSVGKVYAIQDLNKEFHQLVQIFFFEELKKKLLLNRG